MIVESSWVLCINSTQVLFLYCERIVGLGHSSSYGLFSEFMGYDDSFKGYVGDLMGYTVIYRRITVV